MKLVDFLKASFSAAKEEGIAFDDVITDTAPEAAIAGAIPPDPRVAELQQQLEQMQANNRAAAAATFADTIIREQKALPAEREKLIAMHTQAAEDDATRPLKAGSRVAQLEASTKERPALALYGEKVPETALFALGNKDEPEDKKAKKRKRMESTPAGRAALKAQEGGK